MTFFKDARTLKLAASLIAALAFAACSKTPGDQFGAGGPGGAGYGMAAGSAVPGSTQDFAVNVGDRVFFVTASTELSPSAQATLNKQAAWLTQYPRYSFTIEGHADDRGTREYNFALGERRAEVTREYLIAKGVAPARMHIISYGKERPVATCDDEFSCWSQNCRAVTALGGAQS